MILSAMGGLRGTTFANVTTNLAFLMPTLTYDADDVYLTITAGSTGVDYTTAASTMNQHAVASALNAVGKANGAGPVLTALNQLTVSQAQAAFDSLSGEGIAAAQNAAHRQTELFTSSIFDQTTFYGGTDTPNSITLTAPQPGAGFFALAPSGTGTTSRAPIHELADLPSTRAAPPPPLLAPVRTWRAWATGFGGVENISGQAGVGSATQHDTIYGGTLGVDYQLAPNYLAGIAIGGSDGEFQVNGRATSGSTTGGHIAFYDIATFGAFYGALLEQRLVLLQQDDAEYRWFRRPRGRDRPGQLRQLRVPHPARVRPALWRHRPRPLRSRRHRDAVHRTGTGGAALERFR